MATRAVHRQRSTLEFALVRHLPCPTDALSSYSPGDGRCGDKEGAQVYSLAGPKQTRLGTVGHMVKDDAFMA